MSVSDTNNEDGKGEFQFFIGENEKFKARLDVIDPDRECGNQKLNRFFLDRENNIDDHSDHK